MASSSREVAVAEAEEAEEEAIAEVEEAEAEAVEEAEAEEEMVPVIDDLSQSLVDLAPVEAPKKKEEKKPAVAVERVADALLDHTTLNGDRARVNSWFSTRNLARWW